MTVLLIAFALGAALVVAGGFALARMIWKED